MLLGYPFAALFVLLRAPLATRRIAFWKVEGYLGHCTVGQVTPLPSGRRFLRSCIFNTRACFNVICAPRLPEATWRSLRSCILDKSNCVTSIVARTKKHALRYYERSDICNFSNPVIFGLVSPQFETLSLCMVQGRRPLPYTVWGQGGHGVPPPPLWKPRRSFVVKFLL